MDDQTAYPSLTAVAKSFLGQREKPGNSGFSDPVFEQQMRSVGWIPPWAWCALFCKLCLRLSGHLTDWCKPGVMNSWRAAKAVGLTGQECRPDSIAVFQHWHGGKPQAEGHMTICTAPADATHFHTIEGNTNAAGSREGDRVAEKVRSADRTATDGLRFVGFIYPVRRA